MGSEMCIRDSIPFLQTATLFPNPANGNSNLELALSQSTALDIQARNVLGQVVFSTTKSFARGKQQLVLPSETWPVGVYLVSVRSEGKILSLKLLKN